MSPRRASSRLAVEGLFQSLAQGLADTYLNVLAVWLGASGPMLGFVAALPTTATSLAQAAAQRLGAGARAARTFIVSTWLGQAAVLALVGASALVPPPLALPVLCLTAAVAFALGGASVPAWTALVFHTVARRRLGGFFGLRGTLQQVGVLTAILAGGAILAGFEAGGVAAFGFIAIFVLAGTMRAAGAWFVASAPDATLESSKSWPRENARAWLGSQKLRRLAIYLWGVHFATNIAAPCFVPYMIRELGWSYGQVAAILAVPALVKVLTLRMWGRIADRVGPGPLLRTAGWLIVAASALWLVSPHPAWIIVAQVYGGLVWGAFDLAQSSTLVTASRGRTLPIARLNAIDGGMIVAGSMLGGCVIWLVGALRPELSGYLVAIALSSVMRAIPAALLLWRIRDIGRPGWSHLALPLRLWAVRPARGASLRPWPELVPGEPSEPLEPSETREVEDVTVRS